MAIASLDALVAGLTGGPAPFYFHKYLATLEAAGTYVSLFGQPGIPGAAATPSPGVDGAALTSFAGQIPYPAHPSNDCYLANLSASSNSAGKLALADRLWHNSGLTSTTTTAQTITFPTLPARDTNGTANGAGVMVGIEVSTATTNGSPVTNTTMSYTNSAGTPGRTATIASFPQSAVAGSFVPFQLQAGDVGVRSIESVTLGTSYGTGVIHLVAYRVIEMVMVNANSGGDHQDAFGLGLPRCYQNTVPFLLWLPSATGVQTVDGMIKFAVN